jgi:F-type H+-transporting ATPase subunit delta
MAQAAIAKRYARALLQLGQEDSAGVDALVDELRQFDDALKASTELRNVLMTPGLPLEARQTLLRDLLAKWGASRICTHTLLLLTEKARLDILGDIVEAVTVEADKVAGRVRARITSATELSGAQVDAIKAEFEKRTGKRIEPDPTVDSELIGGVVVQIGSVVYDGSIKSQLRRLRDDLSQGAEA